ncbi:ADP-ribosylglycohydrolase family protein [bacterium]|nr:ADP-ribosylglycohydrolase family protein [bacterium]
MQSRYSGCVLGSAIGDAMGAPGEFMSHHRIKQFFGERGILDFHEYEGLPPGSYTDDTQMTIATAIGCIAVSRRRLEGEYPDPIEMLHGQYIKWRHGQDDPAQRRGPGKTCLTSLSSEKIGTVNERINNSKGCGGVMRMAPVGLCFRSDEVFRLGTDFAAITHGHPSGYLTAGFLAELISHIIKGKSTEDAIQSCVERLLTWDEHEETLEKVKLAERLARGGLIAEETIPQIGEGWIAEEALGIALYCSLKFPGDFAEGVLASVNHSGDSDSTGAIVGAILGASLGVEAIPARWIERVENAEYLQKLAVEMLDVSEGGRNLSL